MYQLLAHLPRPPLTRGAFMLVNSYQPFRASSVDINRPLDILDYIPPEDYPIVVHLIFILDADHMFDNMDENNTETVYYAVPRDFVVMRARDAAEIISKFNLPPNSTLARVSATFTGLYSKSVLTCGIGELEKRSHSFINFSNEVKERTEAALAKALEHQN